MSARTSSPSQQDPAATDDPSGENCDEDEEAYHSAPESPDSSHVIHGDKNSAEDGEGGGVRLDKNEEAAILRDLENCRVGNDQGGGVAEEREELSEEQIKELKERAGKAKKEGNDHFQNGDYSSAIECYTEALELYPKSRDGESGLCDHERAVCFANRAACHMKKEENQEVIDDCTEALKLEPNYLKAVLRRAQSYETLEKYEDALEDYKKVVELDPTQVGARQALMYLPDKIKEQHEKLKTEMMGKLKELGNAILNPFGLSTDNFQFQQDPNTGGYSVNFKR